MTKTRLPPELIFYTVLEVADILRVSERTVHNRIKAGQLRICKQGGSVRISEQDLLNYTRSTRT